MDWYYNLKISRKLTIAFATIILILVYIGFDNISKLSGAARMSQSLYESRMTPVGMFLEISNNSAAEKALTVNAVTASTETSRENKKTILELAGKSSDIWKKYSATPLSEEEKALAKKYEESAGTYQQTVAKVFELMESDKFADAEVLVNKDLDTTFNQSNQALSTLVKYQSAEAHKLHKRISDNAVSSTISSIIAIAVGILISIGAVLVLIRAIAVPVNTTAAMLKDIAQGEGDLTKRLKLSATDEVGNMGSYFNTFIERLHDIIEKVTDDMVRVSGTANRMLNNSTVMTAASDRAASGVSSVATASEEMAATSNDIAVNCQSAADSAKQSADLALLSSGVVKESVIIMGRIASEVKGAAKTIEQLGLQSNRIREIINTIEDIADQTNLLALNAAIEAARAGDQGRGFAVVADEVRALAERTARATREIGEMIKSVQQQTKDAVSVMEKGVREVENGTRESARSAEALENLLEQINMVAMQVSQIATAAEEQTATTNEITMNIQAINEEVLKTRELAHSSSGESAGLGKLSEKLQDGVRAFKTRSTDMRFLEMSRNDHQQFVNKTRLAVQKDLQMDPSDMPSHHQCRFATWHDNQCGSSANSPHGKFHALAKDAVSAVCCGDQAKAKRLMGEIDALDASFNDAFSQVERDFEKKRVA
ncbi:MAG: MCP four helix bundle domain-containing protein [Verrucomicrobia bacterium]|nr:MCP four helix bundle domain-containing protein [Deltaproteobacteria bacterium]